MRELDTLPPSSHGRLTAWGWITVVSSLLFCAMLFYLKWIYPAMMYTFFVAVGVLVGTPGGQLYQGDIRTFLAKHPELSHTELPWPADYQQLSGKQQFLYSIRGLPRAVAYGFLMPVNFLLIAPIEIGILKAEVADKLFYRHDKAA